MEPSLTLEHKIRWVGSFSNTLAVAADLSEASLEQSLIDIAAMTDERGLKIAARGMKMIIPPALQFTAERLMKSEGRVRAGPLEKHHLDH